MMTSIEPLNDKRHARLKIQDNRDFSRYKKQHLIPIVVQDFIPLASEFPIVFVKNTETGQFTAVAMMGVKPTINVYCQTANWPAEVIPSNFLNYPLSVMKQTEDDENCFICVDTDSAMVSDSQGQALFDEKGEQTDYLKARTEHLLDTVQRHEQTNKIMQYLANKKLLTLKSLNLNLGGEEKLALSGLYVVDEKKLEALPDDEFSELRSKGLLPLIYAHLGSMQQIARLAKKHVNL